jgi:predicted aldo/keto reductase-like oxidoreductase
MLYRRFGRTELQMPVFSCGGMRYQQSWQDIPLSEVTDENQANLEATIHRAIELGINHIETARGYGSSERQLGLVLPKLPRDEIIVQTKIVPQADAQAFLSDFNDSLARLQLEYVDLFSLHGINTHRELWHAIRPGGCLSVARELQKQGKVRHVGFSTHAQTDVICDALRWDQDGGFDYVNLHYYYIFQNHHQALDLAAERDQGVFIISPADKGGMLYKPPQKLVKLCQPLHPLVFNSLWCLRDQRIHTQSLGAARPSDFDLQVSALEHIDQVGEILPPIEARLTEALSAAVGAEVAENPGGELGPIEDLPGHMAIALMVWLRNLALGWDLVEYAKMRYQLLGNAGTWFMGRNASEVDKYADALGKLADKHPLGEKLLDTLRETHEMLWEAPQKRLSESES